MKKLFKTIYNSIPLKKEMFSLLRFLSLPESIYKHLYFRGWFTITIDEETKFKMFHLGMVEENQVFWKGLYNGWEKKSISLWMQLAKNSNVIFDIGANTGLYGLVAKSINSSSKIYSFEPLPGVYKFLDKNIQENSFDINSYELGLSNYNGKAKVYLREGTDFAYSVTVNKKTIYDKKAHELEIEVMRVDSFIEQNNIKAIDLIKLDVETHEVEVLNGMGRYLNEFKPTFIIEVLNAEIAEKLALIFDGMGYLYFNIDDNNNSIQRVEVITKSDHWNFLLCNEKIAKSLGLI